ncbi:MAG: hypothetical protein HY904_11715 [Deltaproteobacteria bacterium]|nr:hypothetical protein [Deltaproteobacteria bacterium]
MEDNRHDEDTRWLDAQLPAPPGPDDPLVRRTVARSVERARSTRLVRTPLWAWLGLPLAGAFAVLLLPRTPVLPPAPPSPAAVEPADDDGETAWVELGAEDADDGEAWLAPGLLEDELDLDELSDDQLDGLSHALKAWPGSDE